MPELHAPKRRKKPENDYRYPVPTVKNNSKQEAQKNIKPIRTEKPVKPIKPVKPANTANSNRRRKQNMVIYYMMFLLTGIVIFSILSVTVLFKLEKIQTEGDCIYSEEEILAAANVKTSVNLLRFDTEECKKRIIDSLVYIDSVQIRKSLPDKIVIQINGASEMADIEYMGSFYTVSENGRILKQTERYNHKNTVIHGFEAEEVVV
ncbi:MAG: FtsQ-type POTRA domain-containing protein, partial [Oscillospiraceae bacterium]|nr:FtsQ-type POTRA domain-containing protein [Oscillospiraceae bacterium]